MPHTGKSGISLSRNSSIAFVLLLLLAAVALAGGPAFRSPHLLEDHFTRYGGQFGQINMQQYLRFAQDLRDSAPGKNILVSKRRDGSGAKFDVKRGWFVAFDGDGTLRTFFIPKDGLRYFDRQQKSPAPPE